MPLLKIGKKERRAIAETIAKATANPLSLDDLMKRTAKPQAHPPDNPMLELPVGFFVAFTIEEQPFGMARHVSMSVARRGRVPSIEAANLILAEFGFVNRVGRVYSYIEDTESGQKAINCVEPLDGNIEKMRITRQ